MGCFRVNKRYYYRNQQTGESQWDYPQPDVVRTDEAMDISTTPPPPIIDDVKLDPPNSVSQPVVIPPPPPAPIISKVIKSKKKPIGILFLLSNAEYFYKGFCIKYLKYMRRNYY